MFNIFNNNCNYESVCESFPRYSLLPQDEEGEVQDIEKGEVQTECISTTALLKLKAMVEEIHKHVSEFKTYYGALELGTTSTEVLKLDEINATAAEFQRIVRVLMAGQLVYEKKAAFNPNVFISGDEKQSMQVATTYSTAAKLAMITSRYLSLALKYGQLTGKTEAICGVIDTYVTPFFKSTLGQPLAILSSYSGLQLANSMKADTEEEKALKNLHVFKNKAALTVATTKTGLELASFVIPQLANPAVGLTLGIAGVGLAALEGYALYKENQKKPVPSPLEEV